MYYVTRPKLPKIDTDEAWDRAHAHMRKHDFLEIKDADRQKIADSVVVLYDPYHLPKDPRRIHTSIGFLEGIYLKHEKIAEGPKIGHFMLDPVEYFNLPPLDPTPLDIVTYSHNRANYFELSLNSWMYNLEDFNYRLHIVLSDPTDQVLDVAKRCQDRAKDRVFLYRSEDNIAYAAVNLFIQHIKPEIFGLFEDDWILPQKTRHLIPQWPSRFREALANKRVSSIHFETSIQNLPFDFLAKPMSAQQDYLVHPNFVRERSEPRITGNGFVLRTEDYLSFSDLKPPFYITPDGGIAANSKSLVTLGITGYHLGFNQEMDMRGLYTDSKRFPQPEDDQRLFDCQTQKEHVYKLSDIRNLYPKV